MTSEPAPISAVQPLSPPALDRIVRTCLAKDPDERFQNVHDVNLELRWIAEGGSQAGVPVTLTRWAKSRAGLASTLVALGLLVALALGVAHLRGNAPESRVIRTTIQPPEGGAFVSSGSIGSPMLSPDARNVVFIANVAEVRQLWVRALDSFVPHALPGTEHADGAFWSPDGRNIAFFAENKLKRVAVTGGPVLTICKVDYGRGGSWNRDGVIVFGKLAGEIYRVLASGGDCRHCVLALPERN